MTHGTILNIYLAHVPGKYNEIIARWKETGFCSYAVIEREELSKDLNS